MVLAPSASAFFTEASTSSTAMNNCTKLGACGGAGQMPPWEAVQEPPGVERLWVFGSGPVPAQPAELLQSDLMRELLAERRKVADFVIIEAPAALNASDCLALAPLVDGILVVADAKHTDRDEVEQVRIQFEQVGGQVVGAVMSNAATAR